MTEEIDVLVVVDDRWNRVPESLKNLGKRFKAKLHLLFVRNLQITPEVLTELEKKYSSLKEKALKKLQSLAEELKSYGFGTDIVGVHYGIAHERILRESERIKPDYILVRARRRPRLWRILGDYYYDDLFRSSKIPVLVGR
ncbi:universal stress protein [Archaeoglobus profundus]|uniref:UspA domain-containing protein n=1 Tax=Archaeoglobus profundus (strain DSM 5631 / JCM 9629 / NBRC 100127 / Av18) TaxID=572546 RepID=D2RFF7_ARCPA|nr:universal stress protein [Archaeoglobus profundus]ADB58851.1 hypothetical protein Arcpr_1807 [Archaeoglobus profundus DSM 5631]